MDWINFAKTPPKEKGLYITAISGIGVKAPYDYVVSSWDGVNFTNKTSNCVYPNSYSSAGKVVSSETVIWYCSITIPPV